MYDILKSEADARNSDTENVTDKKICLILTGGTIGSVSKNGTIFLNHALRNNADGEEDNRLTPIEKMLTERNVQFDVISPVTLHSENATAEILIKIAACVRGVDPEKYSAILLTHGTDTLAFTANYLAQVCCDLPIPLILLSSVLPPQNPFSNAADNVEASLIFLQNRPFGGVYAAYKNPNESWTKIHLGARLLSCDQPDGCFHSLMNVPYGWTDGQVFSRNPDPLNIRDFSGTEHAPENLLLADNVLVLESRPLVDFSVYRLDGVSAVVVRPYHSGTVCAVGDNLSFFNFVQRCQSARIPVIIGAINSRADVYENSIALKDHCILAVDQSFDSVVVKTRLAIADNRDLAAEFLIDRAFEHCALSLEK